jgi:flavin-dependent thymidylate synthase
MGDDVSIVRNARVSYDAEWRAGSDKGSDQRLINYLYRNGHNTPFEAVTFTFDVKAPIFVFRQWHRHRTQCLSGDTKLKFAGSCDGEPYWVSIKEIYNRWDNSESTVLEMELYCIEDNSNITTTNIIDCWKSGEKEVYLIKSECGSEIKASKDHRFLTTQGWSRLEELQEGNEILTIGELYPGTDGVKTLKIHSVEPVGVEMTYDIEVSHQDSNFIANNFCTHNSYNELSARYRELPEEYYIPKPHLVGKQNKDNKQMRDPMTEEEYKELPEVERNRIEDWLTAMSNENSNSFLLYKQMINDGVPRELARSVLPLSTYSHMFATMNLNNLFKFLSERLHQHAQYEIRVYARAMLELIEPIVPVAVGAFEAELGNN